MSQELLLSCLGITAFLYASVGHGGASGYLAFLALAGYSAVEMKSSALLLNIVVSAVAFTQYYRQNHFRLHLLWPFAVTSIPAAFLGSYIHIDDKLYKILLALCLLIAVLRILNVFGTKDTEMNRRNINIPFAFAAGTVIGLLSGMLGIGGGILLGPLLLILQWADMREAAAVSACFILLNSLAGFAGLVWSGISFPVTIIPWIVVAVAAGIFGAYLGSAKMNVSVMRYTLGIVLLFACIKLLIG